jgi:hypothetical protein
MTPKWGQLQRCLSFSLFEQTTQKTCTKNENKSLLPMQRGLCGNESDSSQHVSDFDKIGNAMTISHCLSKQRKKGAQKTKTNVHC